MHELALARHLIELVDQHAAAQGANRVSQVNIRLGVLAAINRALHVSFRAACAGTRCEGAQLRVEQVPLTVRCRFCDAVKTPSGPYNFRCPDCGRSTPEVVTGREMQLVSIAFEEPAAPVRPASARPPSVGLEPQASARSAQPPPA